MDSTTNVSENMDH